MNRNRQSLPPSLRLISTTRRHLTRLDVHWRSLVVAVLIGVLGALAVQAFHWVLYGLEFGFVSAQGGHLVAAARQLSPEMRLLTPALGSLAAGLLLWSADRSVRSVPVAHGRDYIEAVVIGSGRLDIPGGTIKVLASLLAVSTGSAIGREGAMVLLSAMVASTVGRWLGRTVNLRLVVSCGAAAGLASAYRAPLASAMFVAEILIGSLALAQLGPVVVASVVAYGITTAMNGSSVPFVVATVPAPGLVQVALLASLGVVGGVAGAALLGWLDLARKLFDRLNLAVPIAFAIAGLVVGLLSLWHPEVWGNGFSSIQELLAEPNTWVMVVGVLALKLLAVAATTGAGVPGGVFTPTLFVGAAFGALFAATLSALGVTQVYEPGYALMGMATVLAATTRAPVMAALMVIEMTGQYPLLAVLLPACVVSTLVAQQLRPKSVYGQFRRTTAAPT